MLEERIKAGEGKGVLNLKTFHSEETAMTPKMPLLWEAGKQWAPDSWSRCVCV